MFVGDLAFTDKTAKLDASQLRKTPLRTAVTHVGFGKLVKGRVKLLNWKVEYSLLMILDDALMVTS
jgi:hypothetical protein